MAATVDGDERVIAAAQQILKSLGTTKADTKDMILILSNFDNRLSTITDLIPGPNPLESAEQVLLRWDPPSHSAAPGPAPLPWDDSPDDASDYLAAVDDVIRVAGALSLTPAGEIDPLSDRAESLLQLAMARLEDEFKHLLIRNTVPLDAPRLYGSIRRASFASTEDDFDASLEEEELHQDLEQETPRFTDRPRAPSVSELCPVELVRPDSIADLREIADRMIRARYEKELCQVYSSVRRDALDESLSILGVDRLSIEEVQKIEWPALDDKMKKWIQAVKIVVRVLLAGEKRLCEKILGGSHPIKEICFTETAKGSLMQVLNFPEAIAISRRSSEKLFRILDMYEALAELIPDLRCLFPDESGDFLYGETEAILSALGEAAKGTFAEFENAVQRETSPRSQGGEIHPLTRYVMNYVRLLVDYSNTLNHLLYEDNSNPSMGHEDDELSYLKDVTPLGRRILRLISSLESNLEEKSKFYEDAAMLYIFLMNNILYIVKKVKDSELRELLGDHWVRKRRGQVRQYATSYFRASWSRVLSCLRDEGLGGGSSSNVSKVALKERFKNFNQGFDEIYRNQTTWKVQDSQLREELRLSISDKVIPAYRSFLGRFGGHLEIGRHAGKYIKYTADDLENLIIDLFEGSPGPLCHPKRKIST
ncbi:exocyst complex component EXO70B1-like [Aristolochia californica]|uniref:exocyst complex component EXO70B1-like n=1 Tax=Aristolochia californica TaxID=171875 RepID=UPI0035D6E31E